MLRLHQANSSRKWRIMVKMLKWRNRTSTLIYNILRILSLGMLIGFPREIVKMFIRGLQPEVFRKESDSRAFKTLVDVMAETRPRVGS